jgi:hypothetical protein
VTLGGEHGAERQYEIVSIEPAPLDVIVPETEASEVTSDEVVAQGR